LSIRDRIMAVNALMAKPEPEPKRAAAWSVR
jgi:hypothetical protein